MEFKVVRELPRLNPEAYETAVEHFVIESSKNDYRVDCKGLYQQTLENIVGATTMGTPGQFFWLAHEAGEVVAYAMTHLSKDVDNSLCYYMTQAWVAPQYRGTPFVKECYRRLREHAKEQFCKHIVVVSSRNTKAYLRFLGKKWHVYTTLLKEDI